MRAAHNERRAFNCRTNRKPGVGGGCGAGGGAAGRTICCLTTRRTGFGLRAGLAFTFARFAIAGFAGLTAADRIVLIAGFAFGSGTCARVPAADRSGTTSFGAVSASVIAGA